VSAFASLATTSLAVYAIFFSSASQTLIQYLQSELTVSNYKISTLEEREDKLQREIERREVALNRLTEEVDTLNVEIASLVAEKNFTIGEIGNLHKEREKLGRELSSLEAKLLSSKEAVVKFRLLGDIRSVIVSTKAEEILSEAYSDTGTTPRDIEVWADFEKHLGRLVEKLSGTDRDIGKGLLDKFLRRCSDLHLRRVSVPRIAVPKDSFEMLDYQSMTDVERSEIDAAVSANERIFRESVNSTTSKIRSEEQKIIDCFASL
jgi:hypothetical protein